MEASVYEGVAQSFLDAHPIGTTVTATQLTKWVNDHPDGAAIKPDLAIADPDKRAKALLKHINHGGESDNVAEQRRFVLDVDDPKRKVYLVRPYAEVAKDKARGAIGKAIMGAVAPLKRGTRAVNGVKLEELPEVERIVLERARDNIEAMERVIKPTLAQEVDRIWIAEMARRGIPEDQARKIREALPEMQRLQKLLKATT
jgi:hypothetical protein